ncbi:MAG: hypothetical protein JO168_27495 [Solirubrobacterales bacterium]|nr:hypothetical protein [Solirubrobacterales bacterium]
MHREANVRPVRKRDFAPSAAPGAVQIERSGFEPERFLEGGIDQAGVRPHPRQCGWVLEEMQDGVGDHPLGGLDAAEQKHGGVGDDLIGVE